MNLFADFTLHVRDAVTALQRDGVVGGTPQLDRIVVEPPREASHGDLATNAAMVLAKEAGMKPRDLAEALAVKLRGVETVASVDVAGPGFINLTLEPGAWLAVLSKALKNGEAFGRGTSRLGGKVNVEYVSANPTGPMHVGHCR
ncbi:MAG: arginine--tRNA ligase, partial [Alphaproteobacteria bacterium]